MKYIPIILLLIILIQITSFAQVRNYSTKSEYERQVLLNETRRFQKTIIDSLISKFEKGTFEGRIIVDNSPVYSKPDITGKELERLSSGTLVEIIGEKFSYETFNLESFQIKYESIQGWVKETHILVNDNSKYLFELIQNKENQLPTLDVNISELTKEEKHKHKEMYFSKIFDLMDFKLNSDKSLDSLKSIHEKRFLTSKKRFQKRVKIENDEELKNFKKSIELKRLNLEEKQKSEYLVFIDSLNKVAKERVDRDEVIEKRRIDSLNNVRDSLTRIKDERIRKENEERKKKDLEEKRKRIQERQASLINRFGKINADLIFQGKIRIGMTEEMLLESWGNPKRINKTTTRYGTRKQYVYSSRKYVYIGENGKIETIQTSN
ncbi:hypothetical protein [Algoriphagus marincola]|uniref:hypothetical protein n=1 Tax=Algoriphagus marincola TaxID=264027 RepID=UPI00041292A7|nr:hypothetical protein [Algoriphagus marincola]